jgi:cytochrome bd-type quinol oxidase subunit 1
VHAGTTLFTLIGFCGLYLVLGVLFLFLVAREIGTARPPRRRRTTFARECPAMPEIWFAIVVAC